MDQHEPRPQVDFDMGVETSCRRCSRSSRTGDPVLLINTSTVPASWASPRASWGELSSAVRAHHCHPAASISLMMTVSPRTVSRPCTRTCAPCSARRRATARPIPAVALGHQRPRPGRRRLTAHCARRHRDCLPCRPPPTNSLPCRQMCVCRHIFPRSLPDSDKPGRGENLSRADPAGSPQACLPQPAPARRRSDHARRAGLPPPPPFAAGSTGRRARGSHPRRHPGSAWAAPVAQL
jgi:hypothetical protein